MAADDAGVVSVAAGEENSRIRFAESVAALKPGEAKLLRSLLEGAGLGNSLGLLGKGPAGKVPEGGDRSKVLTAMSHALDAEGVTGSVLAQALSEGLAATRPVVTRAGTRLFPDYAVRHKYLETAHKLRGDFPRAEVDVAVTSYEDRLSRLAQAKVIDIADES